MKSEVQVLLEKQIKLLEDIIVEKDKIIEMQKEKIASSQPYVIPSYPKLNAPIPPYTIEYCTQTIVPDGTEVSSGELRLTRFSNVYFTSDHYCNN